MPWTELVAIHGLLSMDIIAINRRNYLHYVIVLYKIPDRFFLNLPEDYVCLELTALEGGQGSISASGSGSRNGDPTKKNGEVRKVMLSEVVAGDPVQIHNAYEVNEAFKGRVERMCARKYIIYNILDYNCEHFANYIRSAEPFSYQADEFRSKWGWVPFFDQIARLCSKTTQSIATSSGVN